MNIKLVQVNETNYRDVIKLTTANHQRNFVATNAVSLAHAWVFYDRARPHAILDNNTVVGFIMFDYKLQERTAEVWRFMIGSKYQGKGYGKEALKQAILHIKEEKLFDCILINYVENNQSAKILYGKLGFVETGAMDGDEVVMKLDI